MTTQTLGTRPAPQARLNQPWRALVALAEVIVAVVAVLIGISLWHHAIVPILTPFQPGRPALESTVFSGDRAAGAIGLVVLAGFLVVDAVREVLLALGTRRRPRTRLTDIVDDFTPPVETPPAE